MMDANNKLLLEDIEKASQAVQVIWRRAQRLGEDYRQAQKQLDAMRAIARERGLFEPTTASEAALAHAPAHGLPVHEVKLGDYKPSDLLGSLVTAGDQLELSAQLKVERYVGEYNLKEEDHG